MTTKTFDAVKLMRELRDRLSQEMEHMTPEERVRHIRDRAASTGLGTGIGEDEGTRPNKPMQRTGLRPAGDRERSADR